MQRYNPGRFQSKLRFSFSGQVLPQVEISFMIFAWAAFSFPAIFQIFFLIRFHKTHDTEMKFSSLKNYLQMNAVFD